DSYEGVPDPDYRARRALAGVELDFDGAAFGRCRRRNLRHQSSGRDITYTAEGLPGTGDEFCKRKNGSNPCVGPAIRRARHVDAERESGGLKCEFVALGSAAPDPAPY